MYTRNFNRKYHAELQAAYLSEATGHRYVVRGNVRVGYTVVRVR